MLNADGRSLIRLWKVSVIKYFFRLVSFFFRFFKFFDNFFKKFIIALFNVTLNSKTK